MKISTALICLLSLISISISAAPVNINSASAKEIAAALNGIGEIKAAAIVDYRDKNGPFTTPQDLVKVPGVGDRLVEINQPDIKLDDGQ